MEGPSPDYVWRRGHSRRIPLGADGDAPEHPRVAGDRRCGRREGIPGASRRSAGQYQVAQRETTTLQLSPRPQNRSWACRRDGGEAMSEERLVAAGRGKWSQAGVPHRGWTCVDIEDLGRPLRSCEMCESQIIRHVHFMEHPDNPEVLEVGCICAGHMEGDLVAAERREAGMRSRAGKRSRWLSRKWRVSAKGNDWLTAD